MTDEPGGISVVEPQSLFGGRFVLGELLGVGGTASVYEAFVQAPGPDSEQRRRVAVKILHPHLCVDDASREAFLAQADVSRRIAHPNLATVFASGLHDSGGLTQAWVAMELVPGGNVGELVAARGPLPADEAAAVVDGVLSALGAAHAQGLVHRDVSPGNVMLARDPSDRGPVRAEQVKLVDFGIADAPGQASTARMVVGTVVAPQVDRADHGAAQAPRAERDGEATASADDDRTSLLPAVMDDRTVELPAALDDRTAVLPTTAMADADSSAGDTVAAPATDATAVGQEQTGPGAVAHGVVGNPQFMSPEQASGRPVRPAGDLYQVGGLLYFLLTAQVPYPRDSIEQVMSAHVSAPPPVPSALVAPARPLDRVVAKAMTKTPELRYTDAAEMRAAIAAALMVPVPAVGVTAPAPVPGAVVPLTPDEVATTEPPAKRRGRVLAASATAAVVLGLAVWAATQAGTDEQTPTPTVTTPADTTPTSPSPSPSPSPTAAQLVQVPSLRGTLSDARAQLRAAGLRLGHVTRVESSSPADTVLDQSPAAGTRVRAGSAVAVTVSNGAPSPSPSPSPTETPTESPTPTPTETPSEEPTPTPTETATEEPSPEPTPSPTATTPDASTSEPTADASPPDET